MSTTNDEWFPIWYWLDDGERTRGICIRVTKSSGHSLLIVDLTTDAGKRVIGKPNWFEASYVEHWGGLVPESAVEGTEPGHWTRK